MDGQTLTIIIALLVAAWLLQFWLSHRQLSRFYKRLRELRKDGLTAIGMVGNRVNGRVYGVLTVDRETRRIIHAEKFLGATIFAGLQPVPELQGHSLDALLAGEIKHDIKDKLMGAFMNAARDIQIELAKPPPAEGSTGEPAPVMNEGALHSGTTA
jgi:DNA-binding transcriptional regulator of glucitol operon